MSDQGRLVAGRYRLAEPIGRGGMGTVWRAEDELLGRQVAVKKLRVPPELQDDERDRLYERTRREARSAARIAHPNVVVVHDVVEDEGLPCVVMEYVRSRTLSDVLKREGTIAPREAARIGRGMVAALRAAHRAGVLHRDVKPANVLLGLDTPHGDDGWPGGRVVLTDFGIATATGTSTLTRTGELIGSFDYLAPERITGGTPGPASDLWALGATLYQAVEGVAPFHRDTPIETAYAIASEPIAAPRNAGPLAPLIESLLAKDPERRMTAEQVERLLIASVETVLTRDPGAVTGGTPTGSFGGAGTGSGRRSTPSWAVRDETDEPEGLEEEVEGPTTSFPRQSTGPDADFSYDDHTATPGGGRGSLDPHTTGDPQADHHTADHPDPPLAATLRTHTPVPAPRTAEPSAPGNASGNAPGNAPGHAPRNALGHAPGNATARPADASAAAVADGSDTGVPPYRTSRRRGRRHGRLPVVLAAIVAVAVAGVGGALLGQRGALPWQHGPGPGPSPSPSQGSPSPSPSRTPTAAPSPTAPAGYRMQHDPAGFDVAVPIGWERLHKPANDETDFISPDGKSELIVSKEDYAGPPLEHWQLLEPQVEAKERDYQRLRMNSTLANVGGVSETAAIWEWTWQASVPYHGIDLGFGKVGGTGYALCVSGPDAEWSEELPRFTVATQTFRPDA